MADSSKLTTKHARPKLGQSPQARWQRRQQEKGNCRACGEPRPPDLRQLCRECQNAVNAYMKAYRAKKKALKEAPVVDPGDSEAGPSNVA